MRHSNFWTLLDQQPLPHQHELIGEPDFFVRLFQEIQQHGHIELSLHSVSSVMDNPYQWSQTSLFDPAPQQSRGAIILYGKMGTKEQKEILPRLPQGRSCLLLSEKKSLPQWAACYYRPPRWEQWQSWSQKLTGVLPSQDHFCAIEDQPWAIFDHWRQMRLLGEVCWPDHPGALSSESWKKFAQLRRSKNRAQMLLPQDWHQVLYCCEMVHQRALAQNSDGFYGLHPHISPALFQSAEARSAVSGALLGAYQKMTTAALKNHTEDFLWALNLWFENEQALLGVGHTEHVFSPSS